MTDALVSVTGTRVDAVLDLVERIGRDRALVPADLGPLTPDAAAALPAFWASYERHWGGFCGTCLDPMFSALRHPCVGDLTYGADPTLATRLGLVRQWLHAVELGFLHPETGKPVTFTSPYAADLAHALDLLDA